MTAAEALVFARCLGFVFRAPGFSHPSVPPSVRACFAFVVAHAMAHGNRHARASWSSFVPLCFVEVALGAAVGIAASALYDGAYSGGRLVDDYVGIRISVPTAGVVAGAGFGRLWSLAFTTMYFMLGADRVVFGAFERTFSAFPPGTALDGSLLDIFLSIPASLLAAALLVAGPALALSLTAQIALAAVGRIVPRFATFPLSFPIVLGCAVCATVATLPAALLVAGRPWLTLGRLVLP